MEVTTTFFEREVNGETLRSPIHIEDDSERMTWTVIRSTCRRLKIDDTVFGLTLKDFPS